MSRGEGNGLSAAIEQHCAFHWTQRLRRRLFSRRCHTVFACLLIQFCSLACSTAQAQVEEITWVVLDWPPVNILQGGIAPDSPDQLGTGIVDRELAEIVTRMPKVHHKFVLSNIQRVWSQFAAGDNICYAGARMNPERWSLAYAAPAVYAPDIALVLRRDRQKSMRLDGTVSLAQLFKQRKDLVGYYETTRSYGVAVDALLNDRALNAHRLRVSAPGELLRALDVGRMDFTLEYPMVVEYKRRNGQFRHELRMVALAEVPEMTQTYVACTRNDWGRVAMTQIVAALREAVRAKALDSLVSNWMPPELERRQRPRVEKYYRDLAEKLEHWSPK